jgi:hypothetical protein
MANVPPEGLVYENASQAFPSGFPLLSSPIQSLQTAYAVKDAVLK